MVLQIKPCTMCGADYGCGCTDRPGNPSPRGPLFLMFVVILFTLLSLALSGCDTQPVDPRSPEQIARDEKEYAEARRQAEENRTKFPNGWHFKCDRPGEMGPYDLTPDDVWDDPTCIQGRVATKVPSPRGPLE